MTIVASERGFLITVALVFVASAAVTVLWCRSMSGMGGMPMPGDWMMSMAWMRMPGQSWLHAAATFLGMWMVMMVAMMLPSLVPMLRQYRQRVGRVGARRLDALTALVAAGYFCVWTALGLAIFPLGVALAGLTMDSAPLARAAPLAIGGVVLVAGALQFTNWKAHELACCRPVPHRAPALPASAGAAWQHGLRLGWHCVSCCAGLTAVLLAIGVMDLVAMGIVMAAITAERLAPAGLRVARMIGAAIVLASVGMIAQAVG